MTMRVTIMNQDAGRTAEVTVQDFEKGTAVPKSLPAELLKPGESRDFWIHASRRLLVDEKAEP